MRGRGVACPAGACGGSRAWKTVGGVGKLLSAGFLFLLSVPVVPGDATLKNEEVDKIEYWAAKQGLLRVKQG